MRRRDRGPAGGGARQGSRVRRATRNGRRTHGRSGAAVARSVGRGKRPASKWGDGGGWSTLACRRPPLATRGSVGAELRGGCDAAAAAEARSAVGKRVKEFMSARESEKGGGRTIGDDEGVASPCSPCWYGLPLRVPPIQPTNSGSVGCSRYNSISRLDRFRLRRPPEQSQRRRRPASTLVRQMRFRAFREF
jgi:hypothetical protein